MSCCGNGTKVKDDPLSFRNHYPLPVRAMVGIFGAVLLLLPYYLLIAPGWNHFSWVLIPYALVGGIAGFAGISFLLSAILGRAQETRIDLASQSLEQTSRSLPWKTSLKRTPFDRIAFFEMKRPSWATDEAVLALVPMLDNGEALPEFGTFPSKEEAQKVMAIMGHLPDGPAQMAGHWSQAELAALQRSFAAKNACASGQKSCGCH